MSNLSASIQFLKCSLWASFICLSAFATASENPDQSISTDGNVKEEIELFDELKSTEKALEDSIDESFLHFQVINELLETNKSSSASSQKQIIGFGVTADKKLCTVEEDQVRHLKNTSNPYSKNVNLVIRVKDGLENFTENLLSIDEEDLDFRVRKFSKTVSASLQHWSIEMQSRSEILDSANQVFKSNLSIDFQDEHMKSIHLVSTATSIDSELRILTDVQCNNISPIQIASKRGEL